MFDAFNKRAEHAPKVFDRLSSSFLNYQQSDGFGGLIRIQRVFHFLKPISQGPRSCF